jgi:hypothetical protein
MSKKIDFKELHRLVSNIDYINETSYPVSFTVDGVKYRAGIGAFNTDDSDVYGDEGTDFTDFFCGYDEEIQYLSRIENDDDETTFEWDGGYDHILDAQDPDDMSFDEIGDMLKKCCNITKTSDIQLYEEYSFNGEQHDVFWMDLDQEVIEKEKEKIKRWKAEMENEND